MRVVRPMHWTKPLAGLAVLLVVALALGGLSGLPAVLGETRAIATLAVTLGLVALLALGGIVFRRNGPNPYW